MKMILSQRVHVSFVGILLLVLVVGFLGAGYLGMAIDARGNMPVCPLMGVSTFCEMNPLEHIAAWQRIFTWSPQKDMFAFLLALLLTILAYVAVRSFLRISAAVSAFCLVTLRRTGVPQIGRALQEAFSNGILHPKIF